MYFKRLELVGFKSFMDRTVLNFEPGVTAVVGPNGCGKSNIFDSIRWVLGEQSAKSLRGAQMEDVIFNGTDTKPALGMAEVSLTFDNANRHFPIEHDEVMITRRLFRSGESEYLLNKAQCRLKDITELLLGTGIGAESYSIIAQGKIDLILSSKPEDRRTVFDEASGITRYKSQKREALRRLEDTDQNLLRVNDIIVEVKRSIGYLERQANKARRYQVAYDELKKKELALAGIQAKQIRAAKEEVEAKITSLSVEESGLQAKIKEQEETINQRSDELKSIETQVEELRKGINDSQSIVARNVQHADFNRERIKELEGTRAYLEQQIAQAAERLEQEEKKLAALVAERAQLTQALQEKSSVLKADEEKLASVMSAMKASQEAIASSKSRIIELASKTSGMKNELSDVTSKQHVQDARKKRLLLEKAKVHEERAQVEGSLESINAELLEMTRQFELLKAEISASREEFGRETLTLESLAAELDSLEKQRTALASQKEFLERLKSQYEDISESMSAEIYLDKLPQDKIAGLVIKLHDVPTQVSMSGQEKTGFKMIGEAKPIDLDAQQVNEKLRQVEEAVLSFRTRREAHEAKVGQLKAALETMAQREQEQQLVLGNKRTVHQSVLEQYTKVKEEEEVVLLELSDVDSEMAALEQKMKSVQEVLAALERESQALEASVHAEQENISADLHSKEEVLVEIARVKTEIENLNRRISAEEGTVKALEETCARQRENIDSQRNKVAETVERGQTLEREIIALEEETAFLKTDIEKRAAELAGIEKQREEYARAVEDAYKGIDERRKGLETLREQSYELQMDQKDLDYRFQTIRERLSSAYKTDIDSVLAEMDKPFVLPDPQTVLLEYSGPLKAEEVYPQPLVLDETLLGDDIQKLKDKIEGYGTVNLVAIEEYEELKKRYDFLTQQHDDLLNAKQSLQEAIQKINRTTRKLFIETFTRVAEEFRNYFKLLFNGGDAQVYLIDENDPLESGIEIICRPPGKKLQNVLLLSGGEKSMAAIALIFAIFKVKPAPFCILDEIDAALDESNVDRFSRLFQEFTGTSQFICITHNKRTIANANVMYGITMQESGVSRIVSVKFSERKEKEKEKQTEPVPA
ncbi:MAG: chromosome segregation SMC family protein [Deltaproteobacteria bacterium]